MLINLKPHEIHKDIYQISLNDLASRGIKNIIIDLDNTIVPWGDMRITPELREWIKSLKTKGFRLCIVSNSNRGIIQYFASQLEIMSAPKRGKPFLRAFKSAMDMFDGNEYDTAVIGDQIFTDILGGKRMNLYTILVEPISKREFFGTKIMRILEKIVKRKGGSDEHNSAYKTGRSNRSSG